MLFVISFYPQSKEEVRSLAYSTASHKMKTFLIALDYMNGCDSPHPKTLKHWVEGT